ncbi:hypothetical protein NHQ30_006854 [Ciborinia camelliae]|nr:hypothetical protein NHQ30_006854 [Ciborinia camelliae]
MTSYGLWKTNANATITTTCNVFSLSRPLNLYMPYFLALGLSIPFMALGAIALAKNGVNAIDGGFIQLLITTTGDTKLNRTAAGSCLGGVENVSNELKELKVRFGELVEEGGSQGQLGKSIPARAGFGTDEQVRELKRDRLYGFGEKKDGI